MPVVLRPNATVRDGQVRIPIAVEVVNLEAASRDGTAAIATRALSASRPFAQTKGQP